MKKMYRPLIKGTNWALAGLLSSFGISACDSLGNEPDMYGVPWSSYAVKGKVTDKETGKPIPGIEVKLDIPEDLKPNHPNKDLKTKTDREGYYELKDIYNFDMKLVASDIDGELNGSFANDTTEIDQENLTHIREEGNNDSWFNGDLTSETNISMQKKSE